MDAAGEDARFHRRAVAARAQEAACVDVAEARMETLACLVFSGEADDLRAAAERGDIVRGVARAAGKNLRRVVPEE